MIKTKNYEKRFSLELHYTIKSPSPGEGRDRGRGRYLPTTLPYTQTVKIVLITRRLTK